MSTKLNRRGFIKISTAAAGGLLVGFYLPGKGELAAQSVGTIKNLNAFVHIGTDDLVTFIIHKPENGQGTTTSLCAVTCRRTGSRLEEDPMGIRSDRPGLRQWRSTGNCRQSGGTVHVQSSASGRCRCSRDVDSGCRATMGNRQGTMPR